MPVVPLCNTKHIAYWLLFPYSSRGGKCPSRGFQFPVLTSLREQVLEMQHFGTYSFQTFYFYMIRTTI